jgi:hypothetical protein
MESIAFDDIHRQERKSFLLKKRMPVRKKRGNNH